MPAAAARNAGEGRRNRLPHLTPGLPLLRREHRSHGTIVEHDWIIYNSPENAILHSISGLLPVLLANRFGSGEQMRRRG